ncbi:MAG TPA: group 1 truncated hemoglobin [Candidatus Aquabacterium excrementipullorum]|nr:group 1 truncated hemoglobin [Candidatus Aquabacterium excrementipullorum]
MPARHSPRLLSLHTLLAAALVTLLWTGCSTIYSTDRPLYQQLGGPDNIKVFTGKALSRVAADPKAGRSFQGIKMPFLIESVSSYICKVADGPCVYEGQDMQKSHADLNLGGAEFDVLVQALREEMDATGVPNGAKNELLRRLAPSRRDIVTH